MAATVTKKLELFLELKDKVAAEAKKSAAGLRDVGDEAQKAQDKLEDLASRYSLTARNADLLKKRLDELKASGKASSDQIERAQLRYDAAASALAKIERQATRTAEGFGKVGSAAQSSSTTIDRSVRNIDNSVKATDNSVRSWSNTFNSSFTTIHKGIDSILGDVTKLALGWAGLEAVTSSWNAGVSIEANRRSIGRLLGDVEKGNAAWSEASNFARKYGFTQGEISTTLAEASPIIRQFNSDTEETLSVLARMASFKPAQGIEGASTALSELAGGDTQSLIERFNVPRKLAAEMKKEIEAGADPVKVLDEYLNSLGITAESLGDRMEGTVGASNRMRQGVEDLKLSLFGLADALGIDYLVSAFGAGLSTISEGINDITSGEWKWPWEQATEGGEQMAMLALNNAKSFEQFKTAMNAAGFETLALTESEYQLAQALMQSGMSAQNAFDQVQGLSTQYSVLDGQVVATAEGSERYAAIQEKIAAGHANNASSALSEAMAIQELQTLRDQGAITQEEYNTLLDIATEVQGENVSATEEQIRAAQELFPLTYEQILALNEKIAAQEAETVVLDEATAATINKYLEDENAAIKANENAQQQLILTNILDGLATKTMEPEQAMYLLQDAFHISGQQAEILYKQLMALQAPLMMLRQLMNIGGKVGAAIGAAGAAAGLDKAIAVGLSNPANIGLNRTETALAKKNRGGGGGRSKGSGGKSDADKAAEKAAREQEKIAKAEEKELQKRQENQEKYRKNLEERTLQHYARLAKINADYYKQAQENERKFNSEKFTDRANFWNNAADMEGTQRARLLAEEERLWAESQKIAQTGRAAEAQEYYEAGLKIIEQQAERDAQIAELRKAAAEAATEEERKDLEARADLRQRADDDLTEQENQRLGRMKDADDSAKAERDEALSKEHADYLEATTKLKDQLIETSDALTEYANQQMSLFQGLAEAAAKAQAAVNTFVPGSTVAPEARAFGGRIHTNQPYIINDGTGRNAGPELIVPDRPGTVIPADRTAAILQAERSVMQPRSTAFPQAGSSSVSSTVLNMPVNLTFATGTPTREVQATRSEIVALMDERIALANRRSGAAALRRSRT